MAFDICISPFVFFLCIISLVPRVTEFSSRKAIPQNDGVGDEFSELLDNILSEDFGDLSEEQFFTALSALDEEHQEGTGFAPCNLYRSPWPHQTRVVRSLVLSFPDRFLLCDEVGLGKTIEAGLAIKSLMRIL
jgi:hypothetical protein